MTSISIIGFGAVGKTLSLCFDQVGLHILSIYNRSSANLKDIPHTLPKTRICSQLKELIPADIIFITVPDDQIQTVALQLDQSGIDLSNSIVVHCSGLHPASILKKLEPVCLGIAAVHPIYNFSSPDDDAENFADTPCIVSGGEDCLDAVEELFSQIKAKPFRIADQDKHAYHAACVMALTFPACLAESIKQLLQKSGLSPEKAIKLTQDMLASTTASLTQTPTSNFNAFFGGPIARGETQAVRAHLEAQSSSRHSDVYKALALQGIDMSELSETDKLSLSHLIKKY